MTHPRMSKREKEVKNLLLSGYSRHAIASTLKVSPTTVYNITNHLLSLGEIRQVPGTKSPAIYEDPHSEPNIPPTGGCPGKSVNNGRADENNGSPLPADDTFPTLNLKGIVPGKKCPEGYVIAHMSGGIRFDKVRKVGNFDPIKDVQGRTIGLWEPEKPTKMKGNRVRVATVHIFGADMRLQFRIGSRGGTVFTVNPGRINLDPKMFPTMDDAKAVFTDRALYIAALLRRNGWQLTDPEIRGLFDYASPDSLLAAKIPIGSDVSGSDIYVDTSPGTPEAEMSEAHGLTEWEKVRIFANIPSEIMAAKARLSSVEEHDRQTDDRLATTARALVTHQSRLDDLDIVLSKVIDVQEKQTTALVNVVDQTTKIVTAQTNINAAIAAGTQRQLDSFNTNATASDSNDRRPDSNDSHKPTHLEGYI